MIDDFINHRIYFNRSTDDREDLVVVDIKRSEKGTVQSLVCRNQWGLEREFIQVTEDTDHD